MAKSRKVELSIVVGVLLILLGVVVAGVATKRASDSVILSAPRDLRSFAAELGTAADSEATNLGGELHVKQIYSTYESDQAIILEGLKNSGSKAVILSPDDQEYVKAAVDSLNAAGIPVVSVGCFSDFPPAVSCVSPDYEAGGIQAADAIAEAIGESGSVIMLQAYSSRYVDPQIKDGFRKGLAKYPEIELIEEVPFSKYPGSLVQTVTEAREVIEANPEVKAVFSEEDWKAVELIQDLSPSAGRDIQVFGFGGTPEALSAIRKGTMLGTIDLQPELVGIEAMKQVKTILDGQTPEAEKKIAVMKVDAANIDEFDNAPLIPLYAALSSFRDEWLD